jgi:hypothetical protein
MADIGLLVALLSGALSGYVTWQSATPPCARFPERGRA